jgi:hypothetical protein
VGHVTGVVRFVCSRGFFQYSKLARTVEVVVPLLVLLVAIVAGKAEFKKLKLFR